MVIRSGQIFTRVLEIQRKDGQVSYVLQRVAKPRTPSRDIDSPMEMITIEQTFTGTLDDSKDDTKQPCQKEVESKSVDFDRVMKEWCTSVHTNQE